MLQHGCHIKQNICEHVPDYEKTFAMPIMLPIAFDSRRRQHIGLFSILGDDGMNFYDEIVMDWFSFIRNQSANMKKTSIETHTHDRFKRFIFTLLYMTWMVDSLRYIRCTCIFLPYYHGWYCQCWIFELGCNFSRWPLEWFNMQHTLLLLKMFSKEDKIPGSSKYVRKSCAKNHPEKKQKKTTKRQQFFTYLEDPGIVHFDWTPRDQNAWAIQTCSFTAPEVNTEIYNFPFPQRQAKIKVKHPQTHFTEKRGW